MPRMISMLRILGKERDLTPPTDLVVVRGVPQVGPQQHQRIGVAAGILHRLTQLLLGAVDFQLSQQLYSGRRVQPVQ